MSDTVLGFLVGLPIVVVVGTMAYFAMRFLDWLTRPIDRFLERERQRARQGAAPATEEDRP